MESSNTIHRMESYDFKSPIDVVWFEEENSRGEIDLTSSPDLVAESVESVPNKLIVKDITNNDKQVNQESDHTSNNIQVNSITTNKRKLKPSQTSAKRKKNCKSNDPSISKTDIQNINQNNDNLKTLSKYLTLIVESYNQYLCVLNNTKCTYNDVSISKKRQQLGDPSITRITSATNKDSGMDVQQYSTNPNQDQYNIFSSGPQGRQISISVNKSLIFTLYIYSFRTKSNHSTK
ncbi:uncharacterized protein LOC132902427 [Amyelois transitella]|uniref:uncharacterized protein LOC132902427 n=1 Tax=Amyelois transitella TaxID=680683 RepID=UPI00298F7946|nr:uncharacterized protein LOC132902427 [Amyelois transitella]